MKQSNLFGSSSAECIGFSIGQLEQIELGIKANIEVSIYSKLEFNHKQMRYIREGLELGLDVSSYANPELDEFHMFGRLLELKKSI